MNNNDMIRRGDALAAVQEWTYCCDAEESIAALPAVTVRMKPLVWQFEQEDVQVANTSAQHQYRIVFDRRVVVGPWMWFCDGQWICCETEGAAKAAAQADYEARILAALEPVAAPVEWKGVLEWDDTGEKTLLDWYSGGADPAGNFGRMGLRRELPDGRVLYRTYSAHGPWDADSRPMPVDAPDPAAIREAVELAVDYCNWHYLRDGGLPSAVDEILEILATRKKGPTNDRN